MEFADDTKCYIQFDLFGTECSLYQLNTSVDMISDGQRIKRIAKLKNEGQLHRVLMSHDIHTKHRLVCALLNFLIRFEINLANLGLIATY